MIQNLSTDELTLKSRRAAWRERKEAKKDAKDANQDSHPTSSDGEEGKVKLIHEDLTTENMTSKILEQGTRKVKASFY